MPPSTSAHSATPSRVMVVDDNPVIRRMLAAALGQAGLVVVEASDGRAAMARFQREPSDVVVTDLNMPGLGGLDLLAELQRERARPEVILLTGMGADRARSADRARTLGAHDYIPKTPAALVAVVVAVDRALARRRRRLCDPPGPRQAHTEAAPEGARRPGYDPAVALATEAEPPTGPSSFREEAAGAF